LQMTATRRRQRARRCSASITRRFSRGWDWRQRNAGAECGGRNLAAVRNTNGYT
jgi:hypothetical protein